MIDATTTDARARTRGSKAREAFPAYGAGAGVLSFRYALAPRERGVINRALAIVSRCLREPGTDSIDPMAAREYVCLQIGGEPVEVFCALYLDSQNRVIAFDRLSVGTLAQTSVYPRELARASLAHNAAAVILAHNHPSGSLHPSKADAALTQTIKAALALVDVRVLDHVIVGGGKSVSMASMGML